jgi:hypothetical protein
MWSPKLHNKLVDPNFRQPFAYYAESMKNILRLLVSSFVASFCAEAAHAADLAALPAGAYSAGTVKGDVTYKLPGSSNYVKLESGTALPQGVTIKTGEKSSAMIVFGSGSTAAIPAKSTVEVTKFEQAAFTGPVPVNGEPAVSNTEIRVIDGSVTSKVAKLKKGSSFKVNSPVGAAGVRGTTFNVSYNLSTGQFSIATLEGRVVFSTFDGSISRDVNAGSQLAGKASPSTVAAAQAQAAKADGQASEQGQTSGQGQATEQGQSSEQGQTTGQGQATGPAAATGATFELAPEVAPLDAATFQAIINAVSAVLPSLETIIAPSENAGTGGQATGNETGGQSGQGSSNSGQGSTGGQTSTGGGNTFIVTPVDTTQIGVSPN